ncbi:MAG: sugar phosphate isomerase/epimerase [Planctomycetota bacterium]|nr:sugar phosphate isomerase/epimerase [Planctomycetota bacterium]
MPYRLAGFADEISADIQVQMDHLLDNDVKFCALRGANKKNVLDFESFQIPLLKQQFHNRGIKFSCIASPVGKSPLADPFENEMQRFQVACQRAKEFETRVIRVFAFRLPDANHAAHRPEVVRRMKEFAQYAKEQGLNLLLEYHDGTYGDSADRVAEVVAGVGLPNLMVAFDFANCVACGEDPLQAWGKLKAWTRDIHIKDHTGAANVPAGQGKGRIKEVLAEAFANNWMGMLTLEPHLTKAPGLEGKSGPELFKIAAEALKRILAEIGAK